MNNKVSIITRWWYIDAGGLLVCVIVSVLCYYGFIRPAIGCRQTYDEIQPQIAQRTQDVQNARAELSAMQNELYDIQAQLQDLPLRLESSAQVNRRLAGLADLAAKMGLDVHQMQPDDVLAGQRYDIVPIALSGIGDYNQVTCFMREVHDQYADVAVIGFELMSKNPNAQSAHFDIGLVWYTLPALGMANN